LLSQLKIKEEVLIMMANEEKLNKKNASAKDVSVPVSKDATLHIPDEIIKTEAAKLNAEEQKHFQCERIAAQYFLAHRNKTICVGNGIYKAQLNTYEEVLKTIEATPESIVDELSRLYAELESMKNQSYRNDGYRSAAIDLASRNGNY
jgi:hypothetical protein